MRKAFGIIGVLVIGCTQVYGNNSEDNKILFNETPYEIIKTAEDRHITYQMLSLKEQILSYFEDEYERILYEGEIIEDDNISQGNIAQILCKYIERSPIYLPKKELCDNPFIGRLVVEGIWDHYSYDETKIITLSDWEVLLNRAKQFNEDENYAKTTLENNELDLRQKKEDYIKRVNKGSVFEEFPLGKLTKSDLEVSLYEKNYVLYQFLGTNYISLEVLENMGFKKQLYNNQTQLIWQGVQGINEIQSELDNKSFHMSNKAIYIGELKTYALSTDSDILIPLRAIQVYFNLNITDDKVALTFKNHIISEYLLCDEYAIINQTNQNLKIQYTDLYWDGKGIVENTSEFKQIEGYGKLIKNNNLYTLRHAQYLTTIISTIETDYQVITINHKLGQDAAELLKKYQEVIRQEERKKQNDSFKEATQEMFPATIIIGTMKRDVSGFIKGQQVEVWRADDGVSYWVKNVNDKMVKIPWSSISIPKNPITAKDKPTKEQIEAFINKQSMTSKTDYLVWTDLYRQQTYVFQGKKNEWKLIKTLLSSTGKNVTPTPRGTFELSQKVAYFGVNKGYRCKYAFQIFGDYLYHSVIFDVTGTRLIEGKGVLGQRASQGCIRFSEADSLWFYNTMKINTKVWIN